jgi:hypothetical protein
MPRARDIHEYLGDEFMEDLIKECDKTHATFESKRRDYLRKRDKALVATFFLTGGYKQEVLSLRKRNFDFDNKEAKSRNAFLVRDMIVLRQREKIGKRRWVTRTFEIFYDDPLIQYLLDWLKLLNKPEDKLFDLKSTAAWQIIRNLGKRLNFPISTMDLRNQRGLYLVEKRGFDSNDVQRYFGMDFSPLGILKHIPATGKRKPKEKDEIFDIDLFNQEILGKAQKMANFYVLYFSLENNVRKLITDVLTEKYGTDWWEKKVPVGIKENVRRLQKEERDTAMSIRSKDNLAYTNFGELIDIFCSNWNDFAKILRSQKSVRNTLSQFNKIRNVIAHSCELSDDDILRLQLLIKDWFRIQQK